ncbi:MAG: MFS transporter [Cyanobacteria bacterium SBLK]|nr:MFS transporter [Cyanobacteria bacterium SBLK]
MTRDRVLWWRVGGIAAVQGSITLTWVIYALYLPQLLEQLGFARELAIVLLTIEHALEAVIEPISGGLSDRWQRFMGTRFPFIALGIILASAFFIGIPAIAIFGSPSTVIRYLLPIFAVAWASAMAIFRSPAVTLLGKTAPPVALPLAASCLTLAQQIVGGLRFTAYGFILGLGPAFAFAIGSVALLAGAAFLRFVTPPEAPQLEEKSTPEGLNLPTILTIIGTGIGIAWAFRFLFATLGPVYSNFLDSDAGWAMTGFSLGMAMCALPAGKLATKWGNTPAMLGGMGSAIALLLALTFLPVSLAVAIASVVLAFSFSLILNGMVPFVLGLIPQGRSGFGIGLFFGGFSAAMSFFDGIFSTVKGLPTTGICGAIALAFAGTLIALSTRISPKIEGQSS